MWQKLSLIHHLLLVEEQSQQSLLIRQTLSGSNTSVCPHIGFCWNGALACTSRPIHAHTLKHAFVPVILFIPCGPSYIGLLCLTCKWGKCAHAGALPLCVPNPLAAFSLFRDYPVFKRHRHFSLYSSHLVGLTASQQSSLSSRHHYHLNVFSDMTAESNNLSLCPCIHVCGSVYAVSMCNDCDCTHEYVF